MVDNRVFGAKVLENVSACISEVRLLGIYDGEDFSRVVVQHKGTDTAQAEVEVVDDITRLVEIAAFCD